MNRNERIAIYLKELAADFLAGESSPNSLISVTDCFLSTDLKNAKVLLTVLPENKEADVLKSLNQKRNDFQKYISSKLKTRFIPHTEFMVDKGEKNRQRIDELTR